MKPETRGINCISVGGEIGIRDTAPEAFEQVKLMEEEAYVNRRKRRAREQPETAREGETHPQAGAPFVLED